MATLSLRVDDALRPTDDDPDLPRPERQRDAPADPTGMRVRPVPFRPETFPVRRP